MEAAGASTPRDARTGQGAAWNTRVHHPLPCALAGASLSHRTCSIPSQVTVEGSASAAELSSLRPGTNYMVSVLPVYEGRAGRGLRGQVTTDMHVASLCRICRFGHYTDEPRVAGGLRPRGGRAVTWASGSLAFPSHVSSQATAGLDLEPFLLPVKGIHSSPRH